MTDMMERTGTGQCPVGKPHLHSDKAYHLRGCRHPDAIAAHERHLAKKREYECSPDRLASKAAGAGYSSPDPRRPWRSGTRRTKVDRNALFLLLHGFADRPTKHELAVAAAILTGAIPGSDRPLKPEQAAERLGIQVHCLDEALRRITDHREQRTQRRLADAQRRAQVARRAQRRAEHRRRVELWAHRGALPRRIEVLRSKGEVRCDGCGIIIAAGMRYRAITLGSSTTEVGYARECAGCAVRPDGCAVCGKIQRDHAADFPYAAPDATLTLRRLQYRRALRRGLVPPSHVAEAVRLR